MTATLRPEVVDDDIPTIMRHRRQAQETTIVVRINGEPVAISPNSFRPAAAYQITIDVNLTANDLRALLEAKR